MVKANAGGSSEYTGGQSMAIATPQDSGIDDAWAEFAVVSPETDHETGHEPDDSNSEEIDETDIDEGDGVDDGWVDDGGDSGREAAPAAENEAESESSGEEIDASPEIADDGEIPEGEGDLADEPDTETEAEPEPGIASVPPESPESVYQRKIREAESDFAEACLELADLEQTLADTKDQIKDQKEVTKALAAKLRTIKKQGEAQLELFNQNENQNNSRHDAGDSTDTMPQDAVSGNAGDSSEGLGGSVGHATQDVHGDSQGSTGDTAFNSELAETVQPGTFVANHEDDWRSVPISELHLENVKGFGKKKIEEIADMYPTIGDLEDLRASSGLRSVPGIGRNKADAIEDAILSWLSANRDADVLAAAAPRRQMDDERQLSPVERENQIRERHKDLKLSGKWTPKLGFEGAFESGRAAFADLNKDVFDCPWTASDNQDAWLSGWLTAEFEDQQEAVSGN